MKKDILYFLAQTKANLKNAQALGSSFWIGVFGMVTNNLAFFVIWYFFMNSTGPINGWSSLDVFAMLGVSMFCFGFCQSFFYGIRDLPDFVMKGSFDSVLLAPINSFFKLSSSSFSITAYGDLAISSFVLVFYTIYTKMDFSLIVFFIVMILFGCVTFICIRLLCSLVVFFIHDGEIVATQMFEIFLRPGLYPGAIFPNKLKIFFMTVIPALITSSVPIDAIKERSSYILLFSFIVTLIWMLITYFVYKISIKRYESGNLLR